MSESITFATDFYYSVTNDKLLVRKGNSNIKNPENLAKLAQANFVGYWENAVAVRKLFAAHNINNIDDQAHILSLSIQTLIDKLRANKNRPLFLEGRDVEQTCLGESINNYLYGIIKNNCKNIAKRNSK